MSILMMMMMMMNVILVVLALLCTMTVTSSYRRRPLSVPKLKYHSKSRRLSDERFLVEFQIEPHANLGIVTTESHEIVDFNSHRDGFVGIAGDLGHINIGDVLVSINGVNIEGMSTMDAARVFKSMSRVGRKSSDIKCRTESSGDETRRRKTANSESSIESGCQRQRFSCKIS